MCLLTALAVQEKVSGPRVRHQRERLRTAPQLPQGIAAEVHTLPSPFSNFCLTEFVFGASGVAVQEEM